MSSRKVRSDRRSSRGDWLRQCGRIVTAIAAAIVLVAATYAYFDNPSGASAARFVPTIAAAVGALVAAALGSALLIALAFGAGFFPYLLGPYLLGANNYLLLIGWGELVYLVGAVLVLLGKSRTRPREASTSPGQA